MAEADIAALAVAVGNAWRGAAVEARRLPSCLSDEARPAFVAARVRGTSVAEAWGHTEPLPAGSTVWDSLLASLETVRVASGAMAADVDLLQIDLAHSFQTLDYSEHQRELHDRAAGHVPQHQGVRGLHVRQDGETWMRAPSWFVANNRKLSKEIGRIRKVWGLTGAQLRSAELAVFEADQFLIRIDREPPEAVSVFRGCELVEASAVSRASTVSCAEGLVAWLTNNLDSTGRLVYLYHPTSAKEGEGSNAIRQWMATNAMLQWAIDRQDRGLLERVDTNIEYNLAQLYRTEVDLGLIEEKDGVKLGAVALAALALWSHPERRRWRDKITALRATIDHLWREDGSFKCNYRDSSAEAPNFYPGEALLFWAAVYAETGDPTLLERFQRSFCFYRSWHLRESNRHPAFVPWHVQANYRLWSALGDGHRSFKGELLEFSFEMADYLVKWQQWDADEVLYPDERGRFHDPRSRSSNPHASATGVYLEGFVDAWQFARAVGDSERQELYRRTMVRGIRSIMQLQFTDDTDMFFVAEADRHRVAGGVRSNLYDNTIRCDNVQHALMAFIKILRLFAAKDFDATV